MKPYFNTICTGAILAMFFLFVNKVSANTFEEISNRICLDLWKQETPPTKLMNQWLSTQKDEGSWEEFSYGKLSSQESDTNKHIFRIWSMAMEVTNQTSPMYLNLTYLNSIRKGLEYWYDSETLDVNWWDNRINYPQKIGETLLLLKTIPADIIDFDKKLVFQLLQLFNPKKIEELSSYGKGANMIDFALHYVYRGVLLEDMDLLYQTTRFITENLKSNIPEDLSFHEHGPQMQIASYGLEFTKGIVKIIFYLKGSRASVDIEAKNVKQVLTFIRHTQLRSFRGNNWDFNTVGRGISRLDGTKVLSEDIEMIRKLILIDEKNKNIYKNALRRIKRPNEKLIKSISGHRYYWESDYTQHYGKDFSFNVRGVSVRTIETETRNGENLKGNNLTYGATFISIVGDEYENVMPVWDWAMIPGTTAIWNDFFPLRKNGKNDNFGTNDFVGGVSDGRYGASALVLNKPEFKAKKGWFFFDKEIVCLGTGIENFTGDLLRTTINQCIGKSGFEMLSESDIKENTTASEYHRFEQTKRTNFKGLLHNKIGYLYPERQDVKVDLSNKKGSWQLINKRESDQLIEKRVFKMWVDHDGRMDGENKYQYVVIPNTTKSALNEYAINPKVDIISNDESLQAVYHNGLGVLQAIFYEPGKVVFKNGWIQVDKPCIIMLNASGELFLADPTQKEKCLQVSFGMKLKNYDFKIDFTETDYRGHTIKRNLFEN